MHWKSFAPWELISLASRRRGHFHPNGRLIFGTFASIAEFDESYPGKGSVRSGIVKSKGKQLGRPRVAWDIDRL